MSFLWLFMHLNPKISAFVVITVPYLHFSYHFFPRRESANVLFATMIITPRFYNIISSSPDRMRTRTPMWETTFARNSHARFGKQFYEPNILLSMVYGRKVLTKSGVGISRKCCFPHGLFPTWTHTHTHTHIRRMRS